MADRCENCTHFDRDYTDDGYQSTGRCLFEFPPGLSFDRRVNESDCCGLFKEEGED